MKAIFFLVAAIFISTGSHGQESYYQFHQKTYAKKYIVKKGDTLSQILNDHGYKNVYKFRDSARHKSPLNLVMWKNGLTEADLKNIEVGTVIYLPSSLKRAPKRAIASVPKKDSAVLDDMSYQEVKQKVDEYRQEREGSSWF